MKKIFFSVVLTMLIVMILGFNSKAYTLVNLESSNGGYVTYRNSSTIVQIPDTYELQGTEFRAAWVSNFAGDINGYNSPLQWRGEVGMLIKVFKEYNLNTMIFHIRTHNNALYDSDLNPKATWVASANFEEYDPLEYLISECHKAGIEFHAWMNPYRISTKTSDVSEASKNGQYLAESLTAINPASDPKNLIAGSGGVILNPGLPNVRNFIVNTCMEVIENYDVDAIHFDDYFYIAGAQDDDTYAKYNQKGLNKADWRREQVNLFIEQLHEEMTEYNEANNRAVQLGISPSGIYKNGNGSLASGSNTAGFAHYGDYLYSDTYKWAKEGWIDYLLPQSYWGFEHPKAGYADVMDWWNMAFEGLDCKLYSGIGLYMSNESGKYSWTTNPQELTNQLKYLTKLENVSGYSIYKYSWLRNTYDGANSGPARQVRNAVKAGCFEDVALYPVVDTIGEVILGPVENLVVNNNKLTWNHNPEAKAYAIYRSTEELTYDNSEIIALVGGEGEEVSWADSEKGNFHYGVRLISRTNNLGEFETESYKVTFKDAEGNIISEQTITKGHSATAPSDPVKEGYTFIGWDQKFDNIQGDLVINPLFEENEIDTPDTPDVPDNPDIPDVPDTPDTPEIPEDDKGCKKDLSLVMLSMISLVTMTFILKKKEK